MKNPNTKDPEIVSLVVLALAVVVAVSAQDFVKDNKKTFIKVLLAGAFIFTEFCY